jgi:MarR-like DNA-binding transcriptional regulator SgrR of sgrS sRNA
MESVTENQRITIEIRAYSASSANLRELKCFLWFDNHYSKKDRYYTLKEILYSILLMEASIEPEKIVINNLHSIY